MVQIEQCQAISLLFSALSHVAYNILRESGLILFEF